MKQENNEQPKEQQFFCNSLIIFCDDYIKRATYSIKDKASRILIITSLLMIKEVCSFVLRDKNE